MGFLLSMIALKASCPLYKSHNHGDSALNYGGIVCQKSCRFLTKSVYITQTTAFVKSLFEIFLTAFVWEYFAADTDCRFAFSL